MKYIGIDVAKDTLEVFIPEKGNFEVTNNRKGFLKLIKNLQVGDIIGVESTSNYHHAIAKFLIQKGFEVKELNPILTKQFIKATIRKKKTDKTDAQIINRLLAQGEGHSMSEIQLGNSLKKLFRIKKKLIQTRTSLKIQLKSLETAVVSVTIAKKSFQKLITSFDKEITKIEAEIIKTKNKQTEILESIPGISAQLARGILSEIGDVKRFNNKRKLVAFAGYDPKLLQSGTCMYRTSKLIKRGSPYLRYALHIAAFANINRQNIFSNYYQKKREEGKHFIQAMVATARKILEIIFTLLWKEEKFQKV